MDIDRYVLQYSPSADDRVDFCLDQLDAANGFAKDIGWNTDVVTGLTIEEIMGALVSAGQYTKNMEHNNSDLVDKEE